MPTYDTPIILHVKNLPVLTSGDPADIGTISIPKEIGRFRLSGTHSANGGGFTCVAESADGTLAAASFRISDAPGGGGTQLNFGVPYGPASAGAVSGAGANTSALSTARTLFVRQLTPSAHPGVVSFYVTIFPLS